jgi:hypothetical protein
MVLLQVSQSLQLRSSQQQRQFQTQVFITIAVLGGGGTINLKDTTSGATGVASNSLNIPCDIGDYVAISAVPAAGYQFDHFEVSGPGMSPVSWAINPLIYVIPNTFTITAYFVPKTTTPISNNVKYAIAAAAALGAVVPIAVGLKK